MNCIDADALRAQAANLGFTRVRFTTIDGEAPGIQHYDDFLAAGRHAGMDWMVRGRDARADPAGRVPAGLTAVALGIEYGGPRPADPGGLTGKVARYAWGRDYHNVVGRRVRKLVKALSRQGVRAYGGVDSRPLIERAWAEQAGLAYLGRNCCAIIPGQGSYIFLAVILVDVALAPDPPMATLSRHCGTCRRCLDSCPTDAFVGTGQLDARRCISYWTIEHRGVIPADLWSNFGRWVFGCDICQEVCPHNHAPRSDIEAAFRPLPGRAWLDLEWVLDARPDALSAALEGSPLRRPGPQGLKRNAAIALGNLNDAAARAVLIRAAARPDPVVAHHARAALDRIG
ncbi:MAG: tRNA epoxyqueuosine(34) reductase QueG [Myxococcota bacterium]|nr:tRNA epoxyqueuosine(34) reductase QueG [Myxococcota bacterium]